MYEGSDSSERFSVRYSVSRLNESGSIHGYTLAYPSKVDRTEYSYYDGRLLKHYPCDIVACARRKKARNPSSDRPEWNVRLDIWKRPVSDAVAEYTQIDVGDQFFGKTVAYMGGGFVAWSSWDFRTPGPVIRIYDTISEIHYCRLDAPAAPSAMAPVDAMQHRGAFIENFLDIKSFIHRQGVMIFAVSTEGLACVWKLPLLRADSQGEIREEPLTRKGHKAPRERDLKQQLLACRRLPEVLSLSSRGSILGCTLSEDLRYACLLTRDWTFIRWNWSEDTTEVTSLKSALWREHPVQGNNTRPRSELKKVSSHQNEGFEGSTAYQRWQSSCSQLHIFVYSNHLYVSTQQSMSDELIISEMRGSAVSTEKLVGEGQTNIWPPHWVRKDWAVCFDLECKTIKHFVNAWQLLNLGSGTLVALTNEDCALQQDGGGSPKAPRTTKRKGRGILLLRPDLVILGDSRLNNAMMTRIHQQITIRGILAPYGPLPGIALRRIGNKRAKKLETTNMVTKATGSMPGFMNLFGRGKVAQSPCMKAKTVFVHDGKGNGTIIEIQSE